MYAESLIVSALGGGSGQAEALLLVLAHDCWEGLDEVSDSHSITRVVANQWTSCGPNQRSKEACLTSWSYVPNSEGVMEKCRVASVSVRFVLGVEQGIVLRNVTGLARGRLFSTNHLVGAERPGVDYVMPVSSAIFKPRVPGTPAQVRGQVNLNFRYAVCTISDFLIRHQDTVNLLEHRQIVEKAEKERCARELLFKSGETDRRGDDWSRQLAGEHATGAW